MRGTVLYILASHPQLSIVCQVICDHKKVLTSPETFVSFYLYRRHRRRHHLVDIFDGRPGRGTEKKTIISSHARRRADN